MSLLDSGTEQVLLYPTEVVIDGHDNEMRRPAEVPVTVWCSVQPIASTELTVAGQQVITEYRARPNRDQVVPVGPWAKVAWDGRDWDVVAEPARRNSSEATAHMAFRIRARTARSS